MDVAWCSALANALWPCSQHLSVLGTCSSCDCAVGWIGWPALGMWLCSCCLSTLSLLLQSLTDFLLKNWISICMMNMPLRPKIRHRSLSWFPAQPGGSQVSPYLLLALHRRVASEFSSTSLVLSFLNLTWKLSNRSCVPCESRDLFQVLSYLNNFVWKKAEPVDDLVQCNVSCNGVTSQAWFSLNLSLSTSKETTKSYSWELSDHWKKNTYKCIY